MNTYRCSNCEITFEATETPRCPECLRQNGIEFTAVATATPTGTDPRFRRTAGATLLLLSLIVIGGALWRYWPSEPAGESTKLQMFSDEALRRVLLEHTVPADELALPFQANAAVRRLAGDGKATPTKRVANSIAARLAKAMAAAGVLVTLDELEPRTLKSSSKDGSVPIRTAAQLAAVMTEDHSGERGLSASSLELSVLTVAVLRAAGFNALLCEVERLKAPVQTPDIAGGLGRFVAAVYESSSFAGQPMLVLDAARATGLPNWAGGGNDPSMKTVHLKLTALDDRSAAAHLLGQRALALRSREPKRAYSLIEAAMRIASASATLHMIRAKVLDGAGGSQDAVTEAQNALSLRDGPAARTLLGLTLAGTGAGTQALSHLEQALVQDPHYWPAHLALATRLLGTERSQTHLDAGLDVAPQQPGLLIAQAMEHAADRKWTESIALLQSLRERPLTRQHRRKAALLLHHCLIAAEKPEEAKRVAEDLLESEKNDPERRKQLQQMLVPALPSPTVPERKPEGSESPERDAKQDETSKKISPKSGIFPGRSLAN